MCLPKYLLCLVGALSTITQTSLAYRTNFYPHIHRWPVSDFQDSRRPLRQIQPNSFDWNDVRNENQRRIPVNDAIVFEDDYPEVSNAIPQRPRPTPIPRRTTTVRIPGMETTRSPCEQACLVTPQYNPVCGSDGKTYSNEGRLKCAVDCGKQITRLFFGTCSRTDRKD